MVTNNYKSDFFKFLQGLFFRTELKDDGVVYYYKNIRSEEQPLSAMCSIVSTTSCLNKMCNSFNFC